MSLAAAVLYERSVVVNEPQETIYIAGWEIHPETMRVSRGDDHVKLEPKVMQVLLYLAEKAGEVVSRQELEEHVWKNQIVGYDAISRTIINIRKALNDSSRDPRVIETIPKVGYRLIAEVRRSAAEPSRNHSYTLPQGKLQSPRSRFTLIGILAVAALAILWVLIDGRGVVGTHTEDAAQDGGETKPAIAVLPFKYLYSNPDSNYFSDGITADLITALSRVSGLHVISRDSAFSYRGGEINDAAIAGELGVGYLLKGNIQRDRDRIRLNVHLIEAQSGRTVWANGVIPGSIRLQSTTLAPAAVSVWPVSVTTLPAPLNSKDCQPRLPSTLRMVSSGSAEIWSSNWLPTTCSNGLGAGAFWSSPTATRLTKLPP